MAFPISPAGILNQHQDPHWDAAYYATRLRGIPKRLGFYTSSFGTATHSTL